MAGFGLLAGPGAMRGGLLGADLSRFAQAAGAGAAAQPVQPQQPERPRLNRWRVFDRVLGGQTVTEAMDAENERLRLEAMRPEMERRQAELQAIADQMGPAARIAFATNPEAFGESLGYQFRPVQTGAGGVTTIFGTGEQVSAPTYDGFGDAIVRQDPLGGVSIAATRGPTFGETTDRFQAETGQYAAETQRIGAGQFTIGNQRYDATGRLIAEAPDIATLSPGQRRFVGGQETAAVEAPANGGAGGLTPAQVAEVQGRIDTNNREVIPALSRMRDLLNSGDVITGMGAQQRLFAERALAAAGNRDAQRRVAATEELMNLSGTLRVGMARLLGSNPSNADIRLLEQITSGDITQNSESLLRNVDALTNRTGELSADLQRQLSSGGSTSGPRVGEVVDGYRFIGGDPANPASWVRQ